jgi:Mg2+ and Co2+ transporter CorA
MIEDSLAALAARIEQLEREVANLRRALSSQINALAGAAARAAPDGTVAIRDPDILAQEQATLTRGYSLHTPTGERRGGQGVKG